MNKSFDDKAMRLLINKKKICIKNKHMDNKTYDIKQPMDQKKWKGNEKITWDREKWKHNDPKPINTRKAVLRGILERYELT